MKSLLLLTFGLAILQYVTAVCNVCNDNGMACISDREFLRCENAQPDNSRIFSCPADKVCTKFPEICANRTVNNTNLACGDTSNCGICDGPDSDGSFACTSRTTFTLCMNGSLTDIRRTCPEDEMCDISLGQTGQIPCVPSCRESQIEFCDRYDAIDQPVVTTQLPATTTSMKLPETTAAGLVTTTRNVSSTVAPTTTQMNTTTVILPSTTSITSSTTVLPTTTPSPVQAFCSGQTAVGYYPVPNDSTCRSFIYCYRTGGVMKATLRTCPNNFYYNPAMRSCRQERPQGCI